MAVLESLNPFPGVQVKKWEAYCLEEAIEKSC